MPRKKEKKVSEIPNSFIPAVNAAMYANNSSCQALPCEKIKIQQPMPTAEQINLANKINLDAEINAVKVKLFKLATNYNICIERDKLLHQRISEILDDIKYYNNLLLQVQPDFLMESLSPEPEIFNPSDEDRVDVLLAKKSNNETYIRKWTDDDNFDFKSNLFL